MIKTIPILILLCISTYTDIKENKIKNKILLPFMALGLIYQMYSMETIFPTNGLLGFIIPLSLMPFFVINMLGAGDIKLFMAIGIWIGWKEIINVMIYSSLMGGIVALILLVVRKNGLKRLKYIYTYFKSCGIALRILPYQSFDDDNKDGRFPYAMVILFGYIGARIFN